MKAQNIIIQALAFTVAHATRLYAASQSGNVTSIQLSPKTGGLPGNLTLTPIGVTTDCGPSPSWLELNNKILYCSDEGNNDPSKATFSAFSVAPNGTLSLLSKVDTMNGNVFSKIHNKGTLLTTANYGGSGLTTIDITNPTSLQILQEISFSFSDTTAKKPFIHQVIIDPTEKFVAAPALNADQVDIFAIGTDGILQTIPGQVPIKLPTGHGPRHGLFYKPTADSSVTYLYVLMETGNMVHVYNVTYNKDGTLSFAMVQDLSLHVPTTAAAAEIGLTPDNMFLIVSSRFDHNFTLPSLDLTKSTQITSDTLFTYTISPTNGTISLLQSFPAYGLSPRQFSINKNGTMVAVALNGSNRIVVLAREVASGKMTQMLGYLDLDLGGAPGLVTAVIWDEEDESGGGTMSVSHSTVTVSTSSASAVMVATTMSSSMDEYGTSSQSIPTGVSISNSVPYQLTSSSALLPPAINTGAPLPSTSPILPASSPASNSHFLTFVTSPIGSTPTAASNAPSSTINSPPPSSPTSSVLNSPPSSTSPAQPTFSTAPGLTQDGIATNCNNSRQVVAGDSYSSMATAANIEVKDFLAWNPAVGGDCQTLMEGFWACVGVKA